MGKAPLNKYEQVYNKTHKSLHPGTCRWILNSVTFQTWTRATAKPDERMLWISAVPGAGKSFLYAFLVEHIRRIASANSEPILFYMFDARNVDDSSALSAACSLAYQLLNVTQISEILLDTLDNYRVQTGQSKAIEFEPLWDILSEFLPQLSGYTLLLDGLDECEDRVVLLDSIIEVFKNSNAKIIVLSRREADFIQRLETFPQVRFGKAENCSDIVSFLQSRIVSSDKLRKISESEHVLRRLGCDLAVKLSTRSDGSFLWARTALREIESKATTSEIIDVIEGLPSDLKQSYGFILEGYNKRLDTVRRHICCMMFRWLICAARPLSGKELRAAVEYEYIHSNIAGESNDDSVDDPECGSDDEFHITQAEIEQLCSSLVVTDGGSVQLAHISIAEFLRQGHEYASRQIECFFVDIPSANLYITMVCTDYLRTELGHPPIQWRDRNRELHLDATDESKGFLIYSIGQWLFHLSQSSMADLGTVRKRLERFLLGPGMLYWLESWFAIERRNLWSLQRQIKNMSWYATRQATGLPESIVASLLCQWSRSILQLLERHGPTLQELPSEIHFIDPQSYDDLDRTESVFSKFRAPNPPVHTPQFQLQSLLLPYSAGGSDIAKERNKLHLPRYDSSQLRIFYVDIPRHVVFMGINNISHPEIRCQSLETGQMLKPLNLLRKFSGSRTVFCEAFTISPNGRLMALLCRSVLRQDSIVKHIGYDINIWEIPEVFEFDDRNGEDWCKLVDAICYEGFSMKPSPRPLLIDASDTLHCPVGRMNIIRSNPPLSANEISGPVSIRQLHIPEQFAGLQQMVFSGDCHYMIAYNPKTKKLSRYITEDMSFQSDVLISVDHMTICCVSRTGNLIVWADMSRQHRKYFLQEFSQKSGTLLPGSEEIMFLHHGSLQFSVDEGCLLGIMGNWENQNSTYIASWTFLSTEIKQARSKTVSTITGLHFVAAGSPAYCACGDRWLQFDPLRLDMLDAQSHFDRYKSSCVSTEVSIDGTSLALLSVTEKRCVPNPHPCQSHLITECIYGSGMEHGVNIGRKFNHH